MNTVKEFPRIPLVEDNLYSFGTAMTVCRIQRGQAEDQVRALIGTRAPRNDPALPQESTDYNAPPDFGTKRATKYGNRLRANSKLIIFRLVTAILEAQGYKVRVSPEGPDGGVDIIASRGAFGFEQLRFAIQVKSGNIYAGALA
jgi:restriction system protein